MFFSENRFCRRINPSKAHEFFKETPESITPERKQEKRELRKAIQSQRDELNKLKLGIVPLEQQYLDEKRAYELDQALEEAEEVDIETQKQILQPIQDEINTRKKQLNKFGEFITQKNKTKELKDFQAKSINERDKEIKQRETHNQLLKDLELKDDDLRLAKEIYSDLGEKGRKVENNRLQSAVNSKHLKKRLDQAPDDLQKKYLESLGFKNFTNIDFTFFTKEEKEKALAGMREILQKEYQTLYQDNPHFTQTDRDQFDKWANSNDWSFRILKKCITDFSIAIEMAEEATKKAERFSAEILEFYNWDQISTFDRHELLKSGKLENSESYQLNKRYQSQLETYLPSKKYGTYGLLDKQAATAQSKWFQAKTISERQKILEKPEEYDNIIKNLKERIQTNNNFSRLAPQYQAEFQKQYISANQNNRQAIIERITNKDEDLNTQLRLKLKELIKTHILSPKHTQSHLDHFQTLNLKSKKKFLSSSQLDNQERQTLLDIFEQDILANLAKSERPKFQKEFYLASLRKRKSLLAKWIPVYKPGQTLNELLRKPEYSYKESKEDLSLVEFTLQVILQQAQEFAEQGHNKTAILLYKKWLSEAGKTFRVLSKDQIQDVKDSLKEIKTQNIDLDESHDITTTDPVLQHQINSEIQDMLIEDKSLNDDIETLNTLTGLREILEGNESLIQNNYTPPEDDTNKSSPSSLELNSLDSNESTQNTTQKYVESKTTHCPENELHDLNFTITQNGEPLSASQYQKCYLQDRKHQIDQKFCRKLEERLPENKITNLLPKLVAQATKKAAA